MYIYSPNGLKQNNYQYNSTQNISFGAKKMPKKVVDTILDKIFTAKSIDIYPHVSPDPDAINSAKVVYDWLKRMGKEVSICAKRKDVKNLKLDPKRYKLKNNSKPADIALILDFNGIDRAPESFSKLLKKYSPERLVIIDHHIKSHYSINGFSYLDATAKSCCSIIYRLFENIGKKLTKTDAKNLLRGMISDGLKRRILGLKKTNGKYKVVAHKGLTKSAKEILDKVQEHLGTKDKVKIYKYLDILSNLNPKERAFRKHVINNMKLTQNGQLAYAVINKNDKLWQALGSNTMRAKAILRDIRLRITSGIDNDDLFSPEQKKMLKNCKGVIIFYPISKGCQMSLHSREGYAKRLLHVVRKASPELMSDGHANRAGGRIFSRKNEDIQSFINSFLSAAEMIA